MRKQKQIYKNSYNKNTRSEIRLHTFHNYASVISILASERSLYIF